MITWQIDLSLTFLKFSLMFLKFMCGANIMQIFNNYTLIVLPIHLFFNHLVQLKIPGFKNKPNDNLYATFV